MAEKYRFLGDQAELHIPEDKVIRLKKFGESFELDEDLAAYHLKNDNLPFLPEADFAECEITDQELREYPSARAQATAPESFLAKKTKALIRHYELKQKAMEG